MTPVLGVSAYRSSENASASITPEATWQASAAVVVVVGVVGVDSVAPYRASPRVRSAERLGVENRLRNRCRNGRPRTTVPVRP